MRRVDPELKDRCERLWNSVLKYGDKRRIAKCLGVSLSEISQQANPEEARVSDFYKFMESLKALAASNPEGAKVIAADIQACVSIWTGERVDGDMKKLTGGLVRESAEAVQAHLADMPPHVQRKEFLEVRCAADRALAGLDRQTTGLRRRA